MNKRKAYSGKMNAEDKENQSFEPQESTLKTPLKQATTSNWFLAEIQPPASGHLTTPPKPHEISPGDPWTPTANLKMLISAASPEIRNREQEKRLSDSRSEILEDHLSGDEYEKSQPSRKEKSLGLLCHKFLARYPSYPNTSKNNEICLDEVAEELNVERRRIYDIVNVLESLHMVSRLAKNRYSWHGRHNLKKTLQILKKVAEENKYAQQIELIKRKQYEQELLGDDQKIELVAKQVRPNDHTDICFVELPGMEFRTASVNSRKDKSLRVMSQKFVMLFLVSTPQVVNLEIAAKILIGEDYVEYLDKSKFKTKIRRLYDIANVLSSLELIKKVRVTEEKGRKPAFKWTGPDVFSEIQATQPVSTPTVIPLSHPVEGKSSKEHCSKNLFPTRSKQGFTRHPSLIKLTKSIQSDQRKIRSAPSSPFKKNTSQIPSSFPSKMAQLAAICKQQLDEQSREFKKRKMKLDSALPCTLASPPDCLKPESFLLPSQAEILPLMHSSVSPGMLPLHSNVSYALYLHPSQTQIMTAYNPSFMVQPVHCVNVIGIKSPVEDSSQIVPGKIFTEDNGSNLEEGVACAKCRDLCLEKEQEGTKDDVMPEKCFKRHKTSLEHSPIRKYMRDEEALQHVLVGESTVNQKSKSSIALHLDLEVFTSSAVKQIKHEKADQTLECQSKQQKQGDVLEYDSITTAQEMPATFAVPTPKTWFPSGYLIPLPHCTKLSNETTLYNKDKAEMCAAEQKSYSSHIAAPLNLMLPPSSVTTVPVVNGTTIASGHADSIQAPSSSVQNFTLQHLGLIQASLQLSADQVPGNVPVCQGPELVNSASKSVGLKQGKAVYGHEVHRKSVPAASLQQTIVPVVSSISEKDGENTFQTPCEAAVVSDFCSSSCESDRISQETLVIPQREHDVSTEDKF
ncbi:transcription factor E2F8 isoform X2 [Rhineura floridana]|uniref:transcription factor E2F8 isoform X2 n=1 Tax=Rhineura floridana TaxID=261503 RepID=UPI002AC88783|nr:transcription factor E2F8 isoform X2 [Rhineura floridana]